MDLEMYGEVRGASEYERLYKRNKRRQRAYEENE